MHFHAACCWILDAGGFSAGYTEHVLNKLTQITGIQFSMMPKVNQSSHKNYRNYYDDETKENIMKELKEIEE